MPPNLRLLLNESTEWQVGAHPAPMSDEDLLDAYSQSMVGAADRVGPAVVRYGRVKRASIGIAAMTVPFSRRFVRFHDLKAGSGVRIMSMEPDGPAARAGLQEGDVITALDEHSIGGVDDLHLVLTEDRVGQPTSLDILRRTEKLRLVITPAELKTAT